MNPNPYAAALRLAIRNTLTPDPYTVVPADELVEAIALGVELQCVVSHKRRPDRAANPWLTEPAATQLDHATRHVIEGFHAEANLGVRLRDAETGLPHIGHAMLRLSFANARQLGIGNPARSCETCAEKHHMSPSCVGGCPCDSCKGFSNWEPRP